MNVALNASVMAGQVEIGNVKRLKQPYFAASYLAAIDAGSLQHPMIELTI